MTATDGDDDVMTRMDWFRGPLLTRHFAEQVLPHAFASRLGESSADAAQRRLRRWLAVAQTVLGPASGIRAVCDVGAVPFFTTLGYRVRSIAATADPALLAATIEGGHGVALPLVIAVWGARLDQSWRIALRADTHGHEPRRRWAFGFNGRLLRLLDLDRPYARRFIEFDLAETIPDAMRCRLLWAIARPGAFGSTTATSDQRSVRLADADGVSSAIRRSMRRGARSATTAHARDARRQPLVSEIVDACDSHGLSVREALQGGVREALELLCAELARAARRAPATNGRDVTAVDVVSQGLTLLYRVLFLLFAEARALVPVWHPVYRDSYTIATLHRLAERAAPRGLWEALQAISRLAHEGCETDDLSMTAFNSQLFSPDCAPLVDRARIDSATIGRVLRALMTTPGRTGRGRERITYADLGVEQLGAVYERILDYAPELEGATASRLARQACCAPSAAPGLIGPRRARTSVRRKETGTFYTPRSLADYLVRDTLGPLTAAATAEGILRLRVLDPAMGSGAFLVSACRYLAYAYEQALLREDREPPATDAARAELRRTIARQCLFGVDLNPMAVQLARLSLWLTTLTTDAPLTFLDHHLRVGDSLVGASLDDLARRLPARVSARRSGGRGGGRDAATLPLFSQEETSGLMRAVLPRRARFAEADDRPETVHAKERLLATLTRDSALGAWLTLADLWCASWFWPQRAADSDTPATSAPPQTAWAALCDQVLRGASVLPAHTASAWLAQAREVAGRQRFFHWTLEFPEVFFDASGEPRADGGFDAIVGNPPWDMVRDDGEAPRERPAAALTRFVREAGIYDATGAAHTNSYQLFVDRSLSLLRRDGGRLGLVVPWGLAADHGSARVRRRLLERCDVDTMISFDNRDGLFPIHRSLRFLLFTCTSGRPTTQIRCRFGERDPAVLDSVTHGAGLSMAPALLRRVSGEGRAFPDVRSREGLALLERLHASWPALTSADGWHVTFGRELHASDDRAWFDAADADGWPVVEGKHVQPFVVDPGQARFVVTPRHMTAVRTRHPGIVRHRLAYRDIASATNRTTLIAAIVPPFVVTTHTLFCLRSPLDLDAQQCLCALMNSFVANYLVRLRVSTHVTLALLDCLPMPVPAPETRRRLAALASEAARTPHARAELQALAAQAYGLTAEEFRHVLSTFPLVDRTEKEAAMNCFQAGLVQPPVRP